VYRYICGKIFMKIRSVVFTKVVNRQTDKQTNAWRYVTSLADVIKQHADCN